MKNYSCLLVVAFVLLLLENVAAIAAVRGMRRWFPNKAIDFGYLPVSYNVLKSPALDVSHYRRRWFPMDAVWFPIVPI